MKYTILFLTPFCFFYTLKVAGLVCLQQTKLPYIGLFKKNDRMQQGLTWENWGSRPYEYYWASRILPVRGKKIIDLGIGLPSTHNWYSYIVNTTKPALYVGIDANERIKNQTIDTDTCKIFHMNMANLAFPNKEFDVVYCISTFEHIPYEIFTACIKETHRVLKDDGLLIITLDEQWDKNIPITPQTNWNDLEQSLIKLNLLEHQSITFGLPDFLDLIKDSFVPIIEDCTIDLTNKTIFSSKTNHIYYQRSNRDENILHSADDPNSCVSFAVLKKITAQGQ